MKVGVLREIKSSEYRVALTPTGVRELVAHGHEVYIEHDAGEGSTIHNEEYEAQGAEILATDDDVFTEAELILKVKEPQTSEVAKFRPGQLLFTYLHLAAYPKLADGLLGTGITAIAYETVQLPDRSLPLLAPMSEVAGRIGTQAGAYFLQKANGGRGVLLGGVPGVRPGRVVVIGGGVSGSHAAEIAIGMQAHVTIIDRDIPRLRQLEALYHGRIETLASNRLNLEEAVLDADLVIGSVLIPGASAPKLVTEDMVRAMRRGSVLVDIAIDQGGCFETSHETTHTDPVFMKHEVVHYAVGNIPGAVPHTSTYALTNATLPYVLALADHGALGAIDRHPELGGGVNVVGDQITNPAVAASLAKEYVEPRSALAS